MAQDNVSSRGLLWINEWDRKANFKRLRKRWVGVSKETDNDQVQRNLRDKENTYWKVSFILRDKEDFILKGVIH